MIEWYEIFFIFLTSKIRMVLGLYITAKLLDFPKIRKSAFRLSTVGAVFVTFFTMLTFLLSHICAVVFEVGILVGILRYSFREEKRMCLFIAFFYETAMALSEFLFSAGLGVLLKNNRFIENVTTEHMVSALIVQLLTACVLLMIKRSRNFTHKEATIPISAVSLAGMLGVILLSEQKIIPINDSELTTWIILVLLLMAAVLFFNLNRQYKAERENSVLKEERAEMLERDYQALNKTYSANAKLYHDIHNHFEVMHRYLEQGNTEAAIQYLENLRTPVREITQTVWTGDEAIDYLINSKMTFAEQNNVQTKLNVEFPHNTDIRSVDLTAILGNLLDNALEGVMAVKNNLRFINLTIRRINNMLIIKVENSFDESLVIVNGKLQTSKPDKSLHGWGLKSALSAAEKYDGAVETSCENNIFQTVVTLSYQAVK